jgi:hypothetical protein
MSLNAIKTAGYIATFMICDGCIHGAGETPEAALLDALRGAAGDADASDYRTTPATGNLIAAVGAGNVDRWDHVESIACTISEGAAAYRWFNIDPVTVGADSHFGFGTELEADAFAQALSEPGKYYFANPASVDEIIRLERNNAGFNLRDALAEIEAAKRTV